MVKRPSALDRLDPAAASKSIDHRLLNRFPLFPDMVTRAGKRIPKRVAGYFLGGADTERGLAENMTAFQRIRLLPRYGLDVSNRSTKVDLFGKTYSSPIGVAPLGYTSAIWPGAEQALATAAERANLPFITSTFAIDPMEKIATYAPTCAWLQLYYFKSMETTLDLVSRAGKAGIKVIALTIDIPAYSKRTRDHRNGMEFPPVVSPSLLWEVAQTPTWSMEFLKRPYPLAGNLMPYARDPKGGEQAMRELFAAVGTQAITWDEIAVIRKAWPGKLVIKGIQHPDDAETALQLGADGVIVSNHGGRQLDAAPASIDSLPAVAERVGSRMTVMMDSGVRSGLDVVKGLVRGAQCCFRRPAVRRRLRCSRPQGRALRHAAVPGRNRYRLRPTRHMWRARGDR